MFRTTIAIFLLLTFTAQWAVECWIVAGGKSCELCLDESRESKEKEEAKEEKSKSEESVNEFQLALVIGCEAELHRTNSFHLSSYHTPNCPDIPPEA